MLTKKVFAVFVLFIIFISGCSDSSVFNEETPQNISIPVWDYSDNYYFIDTVYKNSFLAVMNDSTGVLPQSVLNKKIKTDFPTFQVWVQCDNTVPLKKFAVAYMCLPDAQSANGYNSLLYPRKKSATDTAFCGFFRELNPSEYYIDPIAGFVGFKISVPENFCAAVSYETYEGKKYGLGKYDITSNDTLVLKMFKCSNQNPDATPRAWELKMKNVYRLPYQNIHQQNFNLRVKFNFNEVFLDTIPGTPIPISQILLIDRYNGISRNWQPDGVFDWYPNKTIIPETGDIIFPTLKPFSDGLRKFVSDTNLYFFNEIYTERKSVAIISFNSLFYFLKGYSDTLK
jgi:cell surface protein SprA